MYPIIFYTWNFDIATSTVLIFLWIILSGLYFMHKVRQNKLSINFIDDHFWLLTIWFLLIWRIFEIMIKLPLYQEDPIKALYFWDWDFSILIWIIGMFLMILVLSIIKKENYGKWMDTMVYPVMLLIIFIALAHLAEWIDYGNPTSSLLAITFNNPEVRYTIPVHPVQIYEAWWALLIMIFMFFLSKKKRLPGVVACVWLTLLFALELALEFIRSSSDILFFGIKYHMIVDIIILLVLLLILIFASHKNIHIFTSNHNNTAQ